MGLGRIVVMLLCVGLSACASAVGERDASGYPKLARLTTEDMARVGPTRPPRLTAHDLVRLTREGITPEQIIDHYYQSASRLKLTDAQVSELRARGVDRRVLDYIARAEKAAERTDAVTAQADRDARARERSQRAYRYYPDEWSSPYPYYGSPHVYPYFGYGWRGWGRAWHGGIGIGF